MKAFSSVSQITPDWLTETLRQGGHLGQGHVISIAAPSHPSAIVEGPGFQPAHRIEIHYSPGATPSAPRRLYLKAQPGHIRRVHGGGEREVTFYRSIAGQMPQSSAPICFDATYEPETTAYHVLLEDVSATHRVVHPEQPATRLDTDRMLDALAKLHANWWGHRQLGQSVGTVPTAETIRAGFARLEQAFPAYVDYLDDRLSTGRRQIYESVLDKYAEVLIRRLTQRETLTLIHEDAHAGNFLLPRQASGQPVYLIDWQQWGVDVGLRDVAYLMALFWYPERRARLEQSAVQGYYSRLREYGVQHYDWPACWADYRLQVIGNLFVPFWAWIAHGDNWGFHRWHQLEKAMLAFQDLECAELLD